MHAELEVALAIRTAEEADELASWVPAGSDMDTVVDLLRWEDRAQALQVELDEAPVKKRA